MINLRKELGYLALVSALTLTNIGCGDSRDQYMIIAENSKLANGYDIIFTPYSASNEDGMLTIGVWTGEGNTFTEAIYVDVIDGNISKINLTQLQEESSLENLVNLKKIKKFFESISN